MAAIYHAQVVTTIPYYDTGRVSASANVLHWQGVYAGNLTNAQLVSIQSAFDGAWGNAWAQFATSHNNYLGAWVIDMANATGGQVTNVGFVKVPGIPVQAPVSDNVAALISLRGTLRYRGGHGRIYVPGVTTTFTNIDGNTLTQAGINALDAVWVQTVAAMAGISAANGGPFTPVIWHKKLKTNPNSLETVATHVPQAVLASQRRRLRKVSRHRAKTVTP